MVRVSAPGRCFARERREPILKPWRGRRVLPHGKRRKRGASLVGGEEKTATRIATLDLRPAEHRELLACEARANVKTGLVRRILGSPRSTALAVCSLAALLVFSCVAPCRAQFAFGGPPSRFELSDSIDVPEVDTAAKARLEQAAAFVADGQWDEAIEALLQVMENDPGRVIAVSERRYTSVREYCQLRLAALPAEALKIYRTRVDAQAKKLYDEAIAGRDAGALRRVVRQFFCSSWGDDALFALGEISLEAGNHGAARGCWETLIETPPLAVPRGAFEKALAAEGVSDADRERLAHWYRPDSAAPPADYVLRADLPLDDAVRYELVDFWNTLGVAPVRLAYPRSDLSLAEVRARLVLVSILEGSSDRARGELAAFQSLHKGARGRLGGVEVDLGSALLAMLEKSKAWPTAPPSPGWPTFAGAPTREKIAAVAPSPLLLPWQPIVLPRTPTTESVYPSPRVAETKGELLSYHPIVVGNLVLVNSLQKIFAYDLRTGKPAWGADPAVYRPEEPGRETLYGPSGTIGTARFTMTEQNGRLYARMGEPLTGRAEEHTVGGESSYLVCLDLASEGRLVWQTAKLEDKWAFDGSPVVETGRVYVAMRHGARPQAHVACYDARTGKPLWRQFVVSAESPARGQVGECTHNLLTLAHGVLYFNTNLGAVAALSAEDGRPIWITHYARAKKGDLNQRAAHFYRDLTPCVYDRGRILVAPSDCENILALDSMTGLLLWETGLARDVVHLLGVAGETLWASGDKLWQINVATGKVKYPWPEGPAPKGQGRGVLAGSKVYFPTATTIHVFNQQTGQEESQIDLAALNLTGGNLVAAGDTLLIAGVERLAWLGPARPVYSKETKRSERPDAARKPEP